MVNTQLVTLAILQTPSIIAAIRALFAKQNPGVPEPTSAEVIAAFNSAFISSLVKDDEWLAAHPEA